MADEAVHIGPPPSAQSYLVIEPHRAGVLIPAPRPCIRARLLSGTRSLRRGWRRAASSSSGPNNNAIAAMATRSNPKSSPRPARSTPLPGFIGRNHRRHARPQIAKEIGYPVMVKASAGGGGKGLRIVIRKTNRPGDQISQHEPRPASATTACSSRNSSPSRPYRDPADRRQAR